MSIAQQRTPTQSRTPGPRAEQSTPGQPDRGKAGPGTLRPERPVLQPSALEAANKPGALLLWAIGFFCVCALGGAFSPAAKALIVLYPAGAFFLAIFAYRRSKPTYVSLVCWLWLLSPCIRRIADWRGGGFTSPILLASFLACCVPCLFMVSNWSALLSKRTAPVIYILGGIFYGSFVSMMHYAYFSLAQALLAWLSPLFFALFLYHERHNYQALYKSFENTFLIGTLVVGLYGIYQFLFLAPWDAFWMLNADLNSIGQPEPWQVRVFGTMNAPQVFAAFLVVGLLISFRSPSKLRFLSLPVGLAALILTMARSGWVALFVGVIYLCFYLTTRQRIQLFGAVILCGVLGGVAMQNSEISELLSKRFQSFSDAKNDDSLSARLQDYGTLVHMMSEEPFGAGIASDSASNPGDSSAATANGGIASRDSTIMTVLLAMGWLGSFAFIVGVLIIASDVFLGGVKADPALLAARAIFIALLAEAPLNNISSGPVAFLVWCVIGFCLAQREMVDEESQQSTVQARGRLRSRQAVANS